MIARVADYVARSHDYIESTDLAKRVAKWHESIGPRLEDVEKRGNFDIHSYGTKILDSLGPPEGRTEKFFLHILGDAFSRPGQFWPKELNKVENTRASHSLYSLPHTQNCGYCDMYYT